MPEITNATLVAPVGAASVAPAGSGAPASATTAPAVAEEGQTLDGATAIVTGAGPATCGRGGP